MIDARRILALSAGLALALAAAGCNTNRIQVSTSFDPLTRFPTQATYVWDDAASSLPEASQIDWNAMTGRIKKVADEEFARRGYRVTAAANPEYRISYQLGVRNWTGPNASRAMGTLSLQLVEIASGRRVWTGYGWAEVLVGLSEEEGEQRLRDAMLRMLKKFPPSQRGD